MAVSPLGACVVNNGGGGGGGGDVAHVQISWKLVDASLTGPAQETACPQGFDTAALFSQEVDGNGSPIGSPIIDLFDCAAGTGITSGLPPATYNEWVEITDHSGATEYAESPSSLASGQIIDLTTSDLSYTTQIVNNGGVFALSWTLVGAQSNQTLTCDQAGATGGNSGVEAIATVSGGTMSADDIFDCNNPTLPLTAPYPAGSYTVSVDALDANMQAIGTAPAIPNAQIVDPAVDPTKPVTDLGDITIPIDGM
jgi:hypothetical protein